MDKPTESAALERVVEQYLLENTDTAKFFKQMGMHDWKFSQKKAWCTILKTTAHLVMRVLPNPGKEGIPASDIQRIMGGFDMSNLLKYLLKLTELEFVETYLDKEDKRLYRRTQIGAYFVKQSPMVFFSKDEQQQFIAELQIEKKLCEEREEVANRKNWEYHDKIINAKTLEDLEDLKTFSYVLNEGTKK